MPRAFLDTNILFGAAYPHDAVHDRAVPILQGISGGDLPDGVVLDYVLAETLNGLTTKASHDIAVDFLDRIEANARFEIVRPSSTDLARAKSLFRQQPGLSFVDAAIGAAMQSADVKYLYSFDDDFDAVGDVTRLTTPDDPFAP